LVKAARPARNTAEVGNIALGSNAQAVEMLMMALPRIRFSEARA
jgi:hypothetical protein